MAGGGARGRAALVPSREPGPRRRETKRARPSAPSFDGRDGRARRGTGEAGRYLLRALRSSSISLRIFSATDSGAAAYLLGSIV